MRLHVHEWGDPAGAPVVCLHGLTGDGGRFRRLAQSLSGRRVVAPDLRGHGSSGADPPWDTATHAADVLETLAARGVEPADWIGFSFGGRVAAACSASVERLCLLDPALQLPADVCLRQAQEELEGESFGSVEEAIDAELSSGLLLRTPRELLEEFMPETLERRADGRWVPRHSRAMAVTAWSEMALPAPEPAAVPTLLVTGESSWVPVDVERYRSLGELLTEEVVPGGHSVLWEAPDETAAAVARYLR